MEKAGVEISNSQICIKLVKKMYCLGHFEELTMTEWERRPVTIKTLAEAKLFFLTKYEEKIIYKKVTAKQMRFARRVSTHNVNKICKKTLTKMAKAVEVNSEYVNKVVTVSNNIMKLAIEDGSNEGATGGFHQCNQ